MTLRELWNVTCRNRIQVQVDKHSGWMFVVDGRSVSDPCQLVPLCLGSEEYADRKVLDIGTAQLPSHGTVLRVTVANA
jgi:uncharacterized protein YegJ (DUF2314 family)